MLVDYHDFILEQRNNNFSYRDIAKHLEETYGYRVTHQAISKYIKKLDADNGIELDGTVLEIITKSKSARSAYLKLMELGIDIKYDKVRQIRNKNKFM